MGGQEQQEFESLVEEVDRVRFSYAGEKKPQANNKLLQQSIPFTSVK